MLSYPVSGKDSLATGHVLEITYQTLYPYESPCSQDSKNFMFQKLNSWEMAKLAILARKLCHRTPNLAKTAGQRGHVLEIDIPNPIPIWKPLISGFRKMFMCHKWNFMRNGSKLVYFSEKIVPSYPIFGKDSWTMGPVLEITLPNPIPIWKPLIS